VPTRVYDHTIAVLKSAVCNARLGREEQLQAIQRLDAQARLLERRVTGPSVEEYVAQERRQSHAYGGRSVFGWEPAPAPELKPVPSSPLYTALPEQATQAS
jgi:hypothetical protein